MEKLQWAERVGAEELDGIYSRQFGPRYEEYRRQWGDAGRNFLPARPISLDFEVVDACNLRCKYCYRSADISSKMGIKINTGRKLPVDDYRRILKQGEEWGLMAVNLGLSGEPLIREDIADLIEIAYEAGVLDIRLITNGTLLKREIADKLLDSHLSFLSVSIDAGSAETYRKLKGRNYYERVLEALKYLNHRRGELGKDLPVIRASYYLSPDGLGERQMFVDRVRNYVDAIDFQAFVDLHHVKENKVKSRCLMPFQRLAIFANGDVAPCCTFFSKKLVVGNINDMTIEEIWHSEAIEDARSGLIHGEPLPICRECIDNIG